MKKIKFTETRHFTRTGENFLAGSEHVLADDQAARWVRRHAAVYVSMDMPEPAAAPMDSAADVAPAATVETKIYADGMSATGTPPLPELSPAEQDAKDVNAMVSAADVAKSDSGNPGVGAKHVPHRGAGRPAGKHTGPRNK